MIEELQRDTGDALDNLRDLARGIYPPLLADKGLVAALGVAGGQGGGPDRGRGATGSAAIRRRSRPPSTSAASRRSRTLRSTRSADTSRSRSAAPARRWYSRWRTTAGGSTAARAPRGAGQTNMADRLAALGGELEVRSRPAPAPP